MEVEIPLVGETYTNRSLDVSGQHTQGFYIEVNPNTTEPVSLMPFPGLKLFSTAGEGANRGMGFLNGVLYTLSGEELYSIDTGGNSSLIGSILGDERCGIDNDGNNIIFATNQSKPYTYDGIDITLGTDADLPNAASVAYIKRRVVYDGNNGDVAFADLDQPLDQNSLNITIAESKPDDTKVVWAHKSQIFAGGDKTIEPYYAVGSGNPPYALITNALQEIGVFAKHSIAKNKNFVYFLDSNLNISRMAGLSIQPIGNPAINQAISKYSDQSDAYGLCFSFDSMEFYLLSFPIAGKTWLYNEQSNAWTSLVYGQDEQHLISDYIFYYGRHLVSDRRNGKIYELDFDKYTDNGDTIHRRRTTKGVSGRDLGLPGREIFMSSLKLTIETGASLVTEKANIIMEYSDDKGKTWSSERWSSIGEQGDYTYVVEWQSLGSFYNRMFRFTMTDPIKWVLLSLFADVEPGIA